MLAHVDCDGAGLLRHLPRRATGITAGHADAVGRPHRQDGLRQRLRGTGNWAFNTAYAATLAAGDAYVTRMRDLREAEDYIVAGIPLVVSIAFGRNQLTGAPISAEQRPPAGVVGFKADGDVVVNDPAAHQTPTCAASTTAAQFERSLDRRLRRHGVRRPQQPRSGRPERAASSVVSRR